MRAFARPFGVVALCVWSVGMLLEAIARALFLSIRQTPTQEWAWSLTLPVLILGAGYALFLIVTVIGIWRLRDWGRRLLLAAITVHYGLLFIGSVALWGPLVGLSLRAPGQSWVSAVLLEAVLGLSFGWWYLRRATVKSWFDAGSRLHLTSSGTGRVTPEGNAHDL
jgi:hypothetical protein